MPMISLCQFPIRPTTGVRDHRTPQKATPCPALYITVRCPTPDKTFHIHEIPRVFSRVGHQGTDRVRCRRGIADPNHHNRRHQRMDMHNRDTLLDRVQDPADIRGFTIEQLKQLADELRRDLVEIVSVTGGHLGASLGVVELTVALHHLFDTPRDRLIWDVSHQAYIHRDADRTPRPHAFVAPGWRPLELHAQSGERGTTRSGRPIARLRFPPASAWRWRAISPAARTMWSP